MVIQIEEVIIPIALQPIVMAVTNVDPMETALQVLVILQTETVLMNHLQGSLQSRLLRRNPEETSLNLQDNSFT
jgi:hypothetical protein